MCLMWKKHSKKCELAVLPLQAAITSLDDFRPWTMIVYYENYADPRSSMIQPPVAMDWTRASPSPPHTVDDTDMEYADPDEPMAFGPRGCGRVLPPPGLDDKPMEVPSANPKCPDRGLTPMGQQK